MGKKIDKKKIALGFGLGLGIGIPAILLVPFRLGNISKRYKTRRYDSILSRIGFGPELIINTETNEMKIRWRNIWFKKGE